MWRPAYDDRFFSPPAPVGLVNLHHAASATTLSDIPMLLDLGADVTLLPRYAVEFLGLTTVSDERYELVGFDGSKSVSQAVWLSLKFLHKTFNGRFLLIEQEYGILGRDVLNHLALVFDGPQLWWEEK
jgi:hypothetical protein